MLVSKKKESVPGKKAIHEKFTGGENLQTLRSWIQKIEQTTISVSSRLSAVEKRLSGSTTEANKRNPIGLEGPVGTLLSNVKNKNAGQLARLLDDELNLLHNESVNQQQEANRMREQIQEIEKMNTRIAIDLRAVQLTISKVDTAMEQHTKNAKYHEPFVMHVGAVKIPIEFTGVIGGLLAFTVAILVLVDQKAVLLSPVFLSLVGALFLGCALVKTVRSRTRRLEYPSVSMPLCTPAAQTNPNTSKRKEG